MAVLSGTSMADRSRNSVITILYFLLNLCLINLKKESAWVPGLPFPDRSRSDYLDRL
jgi:hypothetical protein